MRDATKVVKKENDYTRYMTCFETKAIGDEQMGYEQDCDTQLENQHPLFSCNRLPEQLISLMSVMGGEQEPLAIALNLFIMNKNRKESMNWQKSLASFVSSYKMFIFSGSNEDDIQKELARSLSDEVETGQQLSVDTDEAAVNDWLANHGVITVSATKSNGKTDCTGSQGETMVQSPKSPDEPNQQLANLNEALSDKAWVLVMHAKPKPNNTLFSLFGLDDDLNHAEDSERCFTPIPPLSTPRSTPRGTPIQSFMSTQSTPRSERSVSTVVSDHGGKMSPGF